MNIFRKHNMCRSKSGMLILLILPLVSPGWRGGGVNCLIIGHRVAPSTNL